MQINEKLLQTWTNIGAKQSSTATYNSIRHALAQHSRLNEMSYSVYLQGSYKNSTNIRGDSDVDVVVETDNIFCTDQYNLSDSERSLIAWFGQGDFKTNVKNALTAHYGYNAVKESRSGKCLKVSGNSNRLNADVVPCMKYKNYYNGNHTASGIAFWLNSGLKIINYPNLHYKNGLQKNKQCDDRYKPIVRIFKNARNAISNEFPSYFLECLLYNVPSHYFRNSKSYPDNFFQILKHLDEAKIDGLLEKFRCQNEQQNMFGNGSHQTNLALAHQLIDGLIGLWHQST